MHDVDVDASDALRAKRGQVGAFDPLFVECQLSAADSVFEA